MSSQIILLTNEKGGVGKTTTVLNLGEALARAGKTVLLVDLDPSGNLTLTVTKTQPGRRDDATVTVDHIIELHADRRQSASDAVIKDIRGGMDLIAAPKNPADLISAEKNISNDPLEGPHILREALESIRERYDYILVDCSPTRNALELCALVAADQLVVINEPTQFSVDAMQRVTAYAQRIKKRSNSGLWVRGAIFNMYKTNTKLAQKWTTDLAEAGIPILATIGYREAIKAAIEAGIALAETKDGWRHALVYDELAATITQRKKS
ncbi:MULTISPECIES: AAA family ATPase [unclassified Rhodococcus (in: high G+C Gram-positive bacteria)]|uniref:ParA family protein n=1 Tax=Rhodococcus sp. SJ-3 TaxID=3454628 RepID=UPI003F793250